MTGDGTTLDFILAEKLGRTVAEVHQMSNAEYLEWAAYLQVKANLTDLGRRTEEHRR